MRLRSRLLLTLAAASALTLPATATAATEAEVSRQITEVVAAEIPGATVKRSGEEPLVGVPGVADLAAGRAEVMMDPAFWTQVVGNLLVSQTVVLPKPVDLVKPEMYLPTVPIADGDYVSALPRKEVDLSDVRYEWQGRQKSLREFVNSTETDIVAFIRDGAIVTDLYANGWSADVRHQPWSVTKSFISAVVGIAVGEGKVRSVEDPIERYIPELAGTAWEGTTIRNLLEMESGVHWDEGTPVLAVNTQVQQWIQAAVDLYTNGAAGQGRNEFLKSLPRVAEQGTKFSYNSGNTQVLAWMTEKLYGKPFNEIVSEKLWKPAGMDGDARIMTDRVGDAIASQGLYSRVFDLARFGELYRNGGKTPEGKRVVPAAWVRESTTMTEISKRDYAYQWWFGGLAGSFEASGFQGQKITVAPSHCLTGVRLSHTLGANMSGGKFAVEMGAAEWTEAYKAVAAKLGECAGGAGSSTPGAAADKPRGSAVRLAGARRLSRRAALRRGALRIVVGASERTRTTLRVTRAGTVVARRTLVLPAGRSRAVTVPLTRAGRKLLRTRKVVRVGILATAAGERAWRTATIR
jgi:CubicO group peptidase (beta-lactamase class C family)